MSHLWPAKFYRLDRGAKDALHSISRKWESLGYENLTPNDYAKLEPFLEPFDGVYAEGEIAILSRLGSNGVQTEFCTMFSREKSSKNAANSAGAGVVNGASTNAQVWVLEWMLDKRDVRREYLVDVATRIYGSQYDDDETECVIMLTHALATLRQLKLTIRGDKITGEWMENQEVLLEKSSFGKPKVSSKESSHSIVSYERDTGEKHYDNDIGENKKRGGGNGNFGQLSRESSSYEKN